MYRFGKFVSKATALALVGMALTLTPAYAGHGGGHGGGGHMGGGGHHGGGAHYGGGGHYGGGAHYGGGGHYGGGAHYGGGYGLGYGGLGFGGLGYGLGYGGLGYSGYGGYGNYGYSSGYSSGPVVNAGAPYLTNQTYQAPDGNVYPLYYNPATRSYFYYPIR